MGEKLNCWEYKNCGREPGGLKSAELGVCAASTCKETNGLNSGVNAGRVCWAVTGTLCGGNIQGSFALKMANCMNCDFFKDVWKEENSSKTYTDTTAILKRLNS